MKKLILMFSLLAGLLSARAQGNMELPLNPDVLHGTLKNGLNYYILHNEEPKNRANFYIAQKVGSSLETPEQFGLAHFLEHMAFNGTAHFPGKDMLNYLQGKGIRFGSDINAYTSFDETVYNINNVPTNDQALMDSVLLVLYDWSGSILLEEDEIDAERGVIQGEYTMRNDADSRMLTALLPQLYEEYQYRQMPIGSMEVIRNFPPQAIRDYYKKWYRPDLQGIIVVGDFDAKEMEQKVINLFSEIPMPENAAERIYPTISKYDSPRYVTFQDPELRMPRIDTYFRFERTPVKYRNTVMSYLQDYVMQTLVSKMINNRLIEYSKNPECPYSFASVSIGQFLVTDQEGSMTVIVVPKDNYQSAYAAAMGIVARACKTGFMGTEVQRVRDELLATYQTLYNERDKTNSENLGRELISHFISNDPAPGVEFEYGALSEILPTFPEQPLNELAASLLHLDNVAITVTQPTTLELNIPSENEMLTALSNIINADYEPYVDDVLSDPLVAKLPKPGKVKSTKENAELGTKEYVLSNGVRVVVKPTDFANDEILINMLKPGGKVSYPASEAANVKGLDLAIEVSNIGPYDPNQLNKYLAGKKVSLTYHAGNNNNYFNGSSTVKDVQSLFELLYASFTDVTANPEIFNATVGQLKGLLSNQQNNPEYIFRVNRTKVLYPHSPALYPMSIEDIEAMDYARVLDLYHASLKNAADYTLFIVGNVDEKTLLPLLKQYVATLPSTGKKLGAPMQLESDTPIGGKDVVTFDIPSQNPAVYIYNSIWQKGLPYSIKNDVMIEMMGELLGKMFLESLREEMSGTYSPSVRAYYNTYNSTWNLNWNIITNEEMKQPIIDRANADFNKLLQEGTSLENFNQVRGAQLNSYDTDVRDNSFWLDALYFAERGFNFLSGRKEVIESITLDEFNNFLKTLYNGQNQVEIVGVAK